MGDVTKWQSEFDRRSPSTKYLKLAAKLQTCVVSFALYIRFSFSAIWEMIANLEMCASFSLIEQQQQMHGYPMVLS